MLGVCGLSPVSPGWLVLNIMVRTLGVELKPQTAAMPFKVDHLLLHVYSFAIIASSQACRTSSEHRQEIVGLTPDVTLLQSGAFRGASYN